MEGYLFELFGMLLWIPVTLLCKLLWFSLDYLLQIKIDYYVNLVVCKLAVYWSVLYNVHSCPSNGLEKSLKRSLKGLEF